MTSVSQAVATRDNSPAGLVQQYKPTFAEMLPSHINADHWASLAVGALRKDPALAQAAANDTGVFMSQLVNSARLGLEPGTEQFYLTVRKVKGVPKVLGIVGYMGMIELIYRAGAVSSVIAECVFTNDRFTYTPGRDVRPTHEIDWDSDDRGALRLVYAYAIMKDGATSKVVVLNKGKINSIKTSSQGADSQYSPWQTNPEGMWLKSAVRQLYKWVPTSAEYRKEQLRAVAEVAAERNVKVIPTDGEPLQDSEHIDPVTGEVFDAAPEDESEVVDGELVDWPETRQPGSGAR